MALSIKDQETDRLARELSALTGESMTEAVKISLRERLHRMQAKRRPGELAEELGRIARSIAALPVLDDRSADEIIGYDEIGLPR